MIRATPSTLDPPIRVSVEYTSLSLRGPREGILNASMGTDPTTPMKTRPGTGFYKVPSLRGVWFPSGFGHRGRPARMEEWFDPARLKDDYVSKGFHRRAGAIKGHEFGLHLTSEEPHNLIAFLRTS